MGIERQLKKVIIPGLYPCSVCLVDFLETSFEFEELAPHILKTSLKDMAKFHQKSSAQHTKRLLILRNRSTSPANFSARRCHEVIQDVM